jgi:small nuclear ribonucleoprotein D2
MSATASRPKADKARLAAADNRPGMVDADGTLGVVDGEKAAEFATGPLSLLRRAVETEVQVLIKLRNAHGLLTRVKAFDRHFNMVLQDATEMWTEVPKGSKKGLRPVEKQRFISKLFLRGDSVILVMLNPNE